MFEQSRDVERRWVPTLDRWVRGSGYALRTVTLDDEFRGIDRFVVADDGREVSVEYKVDEQWRKTRNAFIEVVSNAKTNRPGWALSCQSTWLLYFLTPERVLVCLMAKLRRQVPRWRQRFPTKPAHNDGYDTLGICVPLTFVEAVAESVSRLSHGDVLCLQPRRPVNTESEWS